MHMVLMLRRGDRWTCILSEMQQGDGFSALDKFREQRRMYQSSLRDNLLLQKAVLIGGDKQVAVFDETVVGTTDQPRPFI